MTHDGECNAISTAQTGDVNDGTDENEKQRMRGAGG